MAQLKKMAGGTTRKDQQGKTGRKTSSKLLEIEPDVTGGKSLLFLIVFSISASSLMLIVPHVSHEIFAVFRGSEHPVQNFSDSEFALGIALASFAAFSFCATFFLELKARNLVSFMSEGSFINASIIPLVMLIWSWHMMWSVDLAPVYAIAGIVLLFIMFLACCWLLRKLGILQFGVLIGALGYASAWPLLGGVFLQGDVTDKEFLSLLAISALAPIIICFFLSSADHNRLLSFSTLIGAILSGAAFYIDVPNAIGVLVLGYLISFCVGPNRKASCAVFIGGLIIGFGAWAPMVIDGYLAFDLNVAFYEMTIWRNANPATPYIGFTILAFVALGVVAGLTGRFGARGFVVTVSLAVLLLLLLFILVNETLMTVPFLLTVLILMAMGADFSLRLGKLTATILFLALFLDTSLQAFMPETAELVRATLSTTQGKNVQFEKAARIVSFIFIVQSFMTIGYLWLRSKKPESPE